MKRKRKRAQRRKLYSKPFVVHRPAAHEPSYARGSTAAIEEAERRRSAQDYDSPDDALDGAASRIGAEWYLRSGDNVTVFMRSRDGYFVARLFKKGGWYHWPTDWPEEIKNLPLGARPVPNREAAELPRWQDKESIEIETGVGKPHEAAEQSEPSGEAAAVPWVKLERDPKAYAQQVEAAQAHGKIDGPRSVYDLLAPALAKEDQEVFIVLGVDVRGQFRGPTEVHRGERSRVSVSVPEILRVANALGGEMFIVVHNHPTTRATPSPADKKLTKAIERAAKETEQVMADHVIVGMGEYFSFAENKLTKVSGGGRQTRSKPTRSAAQEAAEEPTVVVAPKNTPAWLTVGAGGKTLLFPIWGMRKPGIEVDIPEENEGWSTGRVTWEKFRSELLSSAPEIISPQMLFSDVKRGPKAKGLTPDDRMFAEGLKAIGVRHLGSPVWWTDLDHGPVAGASLYDIARFDQPYVIPRSELAADLIGVTQGETDKEVVKAMRQKIMRFHKRPLYLLSLDQWDNQEFPAPSQGGPPFIEHVSVGHEARA